MKRFVSVFTICIMLLVSLAACHGNTDNDNSKESTDHSSDMETTVITTTQPAPDVPLDKLKIMSHNIMINNSLGAANMLKSAVEAMDADVLAFQEVDDLWHTRLGLDNKMSEAGYSMVPVPESFTNDIYGPDGAQSNRNPIYYKTDMFELVEHGRELYKSFGPFPGATKNGSPLYGYRSYSYTWALLKIKESGRNVIVISTHLNAGVQHAEATAVDIGNASVYRLKSASELKTAMLELEEKYGCPVIAVGDYNSNYQSEVASCMGQKFLSARDRATVKKNLKYATTNSMGKMPSEGKAIDQCFFSKEGIKAEHFEILLEAGNIKTYNYSDHVAIYMEFTLS